MKQKLHTFQYGIWTYVTREPPSLVHGLLFQPWTGLAQLWTLIFVNEKSATVSQTPKPKSGPISDLVIFVKEAYFLGPFYFLIVVALNVLLAICKAFQTFFWSQIIDSVTWHLQSQEVKSARIVQAILGRILSNVLEAYFSRMEEVHTVALCERIKYKFMEETISFVSKLDPSTAEDPEVRKIVGGDGSDWSSRASDAVLAFLRIKEVAASLTVLLAQLSFLLGMSRDSLTLLSSIAFCATHAFLILARGDPYSSSFVAFCSNSNFRRMSSLKTMAFDDRFLEDRLSHGLEDYISREFKKSRQRLGDACTEPFQFQWMRSTPLALEGLLELSWDASLIFLSLRVLWNPKGITLSEFLAALSAASALEGVSWTIFWNFTQIRKHLTSIQSLYALDSIGFHITGGLEPYPAESERGDQRGAQIEFRNVSFRYPGSDKDALTDVSFTILPGQLVVIVGVNGSGKSSAIKLLNRLFDPSTGEILLDGLPLTVYNLSDVRRSMAILRQNHPVLPVSIRENVAMGSVDTDGSNEEVQEALRLGGAEKFVKSMKRGLDTVLDPVKTTVVHSVREMDPELKGLVDGIETKTDISGGESQRLAASRTFMRLMNEDIRLLAVDEPTSALDPEGECELFTRLREYSKDKTAIFITHRFGHLTKHADLILCLKDGRLVEQGTHGELVSLNGEYNKLYGIQSRAFTGE